MPVTQPSPTAFGKVTSVSLGALNVASMVMMFSGIPIVGGLVQGVVTLLQTLRDFFAVDGGIRKATGTLLTGAIFTVVGFIPFMGGVAKGAEVVVEAGAIGKFFAPAKAVASKVFAPIKNFFTPIKEGVLEARVAGSNLKTVEANLATRLNTLVKVNPRIARMAAFAEKRPIITQMVAPMAASIAIGAVTGTATQTVQSELDINPAITWQNREDARRVASRAKEVAGASIHHHV